MKIAIAVLTLAIAAMTVTGCTTGSASPDATGAGNIPGGSGGTDALSQDCPATVQSLMDNSAEGYEVQSGDVRWTEDLGALPGGPATCWYSVQVVATDESGGFFDTTEITAMYVGLPEDRIRTLVDAMHTATPGDEFVEQAYDTGDNIAGGLWLWYTHAPSGAEASGDESVSVRYTAQFNVADDSSNLFQVPVGSSYLLIEYSYGKMQ